MNDLSLYGWSKDLLQLKQKSIFHTLQHGRVVITNKTCYEVVGENGFYLCELTGNILYTKMPEEYPCTGDWVLFKETAEDRGIIMDILPRSKSLSRRRSGCISEKQTIASYVDKAFIVTGLDENFNPRRIERFLVQIKGENIQPVLVLTKTDLNPENEDKITQLEHLSNKMPIFKTSIYDNSSIDQLRQFIQKGESVVFVGSSGVGKSSLINALCKRDIFQTSTVSQSTGKGRHTSTRREIALMDDTGVLIDTPGIREFGLTVQNTDSLLSILDIPDLEGKCHYSNCTHTGEPKCAVIKAVKDGLLPIDVYESYLKLRKETFHYSESEHEKRIQGKHFAKVRKEYKNYNKEY